MGLDIERFVCDVNDGLLCCICKDVLEDPLQAPCEHAFCRTCIQGWLINECTCPEDRQTLFLSDLRPLFRYMRNDLASLRLRCQYVDQGCQQICTMDSVRGHERNCEHATVTCPHSDCALTMSRRDLEEHVLLCHVRQGTLDHQNGTITRPSNSEECPMGCGVLFVTSRDKEGHNCVAELRTSLELLRAEITCQLEDHRREMGARLDSQRAHMVQRETVLRNHIDSLKTEVNQIREKLKRLEDVDAERGRELEKLTAERSELKTQLDELRQMQLADTDCSVCSCGTRVTNV